MDGLTKKLVAIFGVRLFPKPTSNLGNVVIYSRFCLPVFFVDQGVPDSLAGMEVQTLDVVTVVTWRNQGS